MNLTAFSSRHFGRNLRLLSSILISLAFFTITFSASLAENEKNKEPNKPSSTTSNIFSYLTNPALGLLPTPTPTPETHILVGSYYSLRGNLSATLMLNNKGGLPLDVTPTFYNLNGAQIQLSTITINATEYMEVDLRQLLANAGSDFREGSLSVTHHGKDLQLGAQVKLIDGGKSLIWDEQFFVPSAKSASSRLESVWWLPSTECATKFVLSNTTETQVVATVSVDGTSPRQTNPVTITLNPHQTKVLDVMRDLVGASDGNLQIKGGISILYSGSPGAVLAKMLISEEDKGFSSTMNFIDPELTASAKWHGAGLHLGKVGIQNLRQLVVARNVSSQTATVSGQIPYTNPAGQVVAIPIPAVQIPANTTKVINLQGTISSANLSASVTFAGLEMAYDTPKGSVVMSALSVSADDNQVFQVPLYDPQKLPSSAGGFPWKTDGDYRTIVYLKNETDAPKKYNIRLHYVSGDYTLGIKVLKGRETKAIDFRRLRDEQTPDDLGHKIPLEIQSGQIGWSIAGTENHIVTGRSEQTSLIKGLSSTYACHNCCPDSIDWLTGQTSPVTVDGFPDENYFFGLEAQGSNCYMGSFITYISGYNWTSSDTSCAIIDNTGMATAIAPGEAGITGSGNMITWYNSNVYGCVSEETPGGSGSGEMMIRPPTVTNITADGATRILVSNTEGDTTITHFVTPKGSTNDEVTLNITISPDTPANRQRIQWEGATVTQGNTLQATIKKDVAKKQIVKIKYGNTILRELRVWVVWATITSTELSILYADTVVIEPNVIGGIISGGYSFVHTIQPAQIITDTDRPKLSGMNTVSPPGMNHPITGESLTFGASKRWDNSRRLRAKRVNPSNISQSDVSQPPLPNLISFPTNEVEGNDDASANEENNDPYSTSNMGQLTGLDRPVSGIAHRAGVNGNTYEERYQFGEFTRLEIEGVWYRISDYYPWKLHAKFIKVKGRWVNNNSVLALDNAGF